MSCAAGPLSVFSTAVGAKNLVDYLAEDGFDTLGDWTHNCDHRRGYETVADQLCN